jgi:hypothetical protein
MPNDLSKLLEILRESLRREGRSIVEEVLLWNDSDVSSGKLEQFLGLKGLMGRQVGLEFDMDVAGGVIDKDTASRVHLAVFSLAFAAEETASSRADEVIHRDALPRKELVVS